MFSSLISADSAILLTFLTIGLGLVRILEYLIKRVLPTKRTLTDEEYDKVRTIEENINDLPTLTEEEHGFLEDLHSWHNKTDSDGLPLWFVPRSFTETQQEIVNILHEISSHQEKSTYVMESIFNKLEKIEEKLNETE